MTVTTISSREFNQHIFDEQVWENSGENIEYKLKL